MHRDPLRFFPFFYFVSMVLRWAIWDNFVPLVWLLLIPICIFSPLTNTVNNIRVSMPFGYHMCVYIPEVIHLGKVRLKQFVNCSTFVGLSKSVQSLFVQGVCPYCHFWTWGLFPHSFLDVRAFVRTHFCTSSISHTVELDVFALFLFSLKFLLKWILSCFLNILKCCRGKT